ncbi:MAG: methyltransferase, CheR-type [Verrucomicrobia bacterium]|nr:methyltransferase, CheR-type [Verrucomicrobiota bacterium]
MSSVPSLTSSLPWAARPSRGAANPTQLSPAWSAGTPGYDVIEPLARVAGEREFLRDIFGRVNLPLDRYRQSVLARHIPACLQLLGVRTLERAAQKIAARPTLAWSLLDLLLPGALRFCPEDEVLHQLALRLLPPLSGRIRVWNVACAGGQELYTLAALLAEADLLADADLLERCELWGSDCRPEAIARARLGEFPLEQVMQLDPAWRRGNFQALSDTMRIHPRLRTAASWHVSNVFAGAEPGPWQVILWRNLFTALEPAALDGLWRQLVAALAPGGYLVANPASRPADGLPLERIGAGLYRKISLR